MRLKRTYSSREVASLTGLTAKQLQVWDRDGLLPPAVPPHRTPAGGYTERRYTPIDLFELMVLADLRKRGFSVSQLLAATGEGGPVRLLTDGREIYARTAAGEFFNLLRAPTQPLLVVGNEGLLKELSGRMRRRNKGRKRAEGAGKRAVPGAR